MKKFIFPIFLVLICALILGVIGLFQFSGYGGNDCDVTGKVCDCFCCHMFGLRGYESCGDFGFLIGVGIGAVTGLAGYAFIKFKNIF